MKMVTKELLREVALEIATSKAVAAVLRYAGKPDHVQAEADTQNAIKRFDALLETFQEPQP